MICLVHRRVRELGVAAGRGQSFRSSGAGILPPRRFRPEKASRRSFKRRQIAESQNDLKKQGMNYSERLLIQFPLCHYVPRFTVSGLVLASLAPCSYVDTRSLLPTN